MAVLLPVVAFLAGSWVFKLKRENDFYADLEDLEEERRTLRRSARNGAPKEHLETTASREHSFQESSYDDEQSEDSEVKIYIQRLLEESESEEDTESLDEVITQRDTAFMEIVSLKNELAETQRQADISHQAASTQAQVAAKAAAALSEAQLALKNTPKVDSKADAERRQMEQKNRQSWKVVSADIPCFIDETFDDMENNSLSLLKIPDSSNGEDHLGNISGSSLNAHGIRTVKSYSQIESNESKVQSHISESEQKKRAKRLSSTMPENYPPKSRPDNTFQFAPVPAHQVTSSPPSPPASGKTLTSAEQMKRAKRLSSTIPENFSHKARNSRASL
eukprot:CAMPEP_0196590572 /NCGR_PEP_ID=MMETSP1081-20130531/66988_1 /TAXON_ID=36882 /ORGANISM="Pyramimonas amylifera, Strain CCMP720" /LENGTH=334 /DNA_ID=CAMNT_0041913719 /DNA_START=189 /DNA_END=1193 /DNA_ORIENTATION=-